MLNEKAIDNLIQPVIDRQNQIEMTVIAKLAERINEIKALLPSDVNKLEQLYKNGSDVREINKEIARLTKLQEKEIKKIIKKVGKDVYEDSRPYYDYRKKPFVPYEENEFLQRLIESVLRATLEEITNLSNSTAFMLSDKTNPVILKPTKISDAYNEIIDIAVHSVIGGVSSPDAEIQRAIRQIVDSGLKVKIGDTDKVRYVTEKGRVHYVRLDSVVRRDILDGIRNINQIVQDLTGEEFESNGKEISVHINSAPDHEPVQGHQFTNEEYEKLQTGQSFKDYNETRFNAIKRPIGVWNCHHFSYSIILGVMEPNYSLEELEEIKRKNRQGFTYVDMNGKKKHLTLYECTQKQRGYELEIRKAKEGKYMAEKAGEHSLADEYEGKLYQKQTQYTAFCKACGLEPRYDKTRIYINDSQIKPIDDSIIDKSMESGIMRKSLYRQATEFSNVEPMPKEQFARIQRSFEKQGVVFRADKEANDYVVARKAEAITLNESTVLFRYNPSRAAVFEEIIHTHQYKIGKMDGSDLNKCLCEIEAKEKLLKYAKAYGLTNDEIEITKHLLAEDRQDLIKLTGGGLN